ncbi:hypothetical protein J4Q44_G00272530 [Coregonus suidteri]|uniref:EF-hand domain-containing protein n=1 Tax=Coregonus suidteri TaxID=861788 RepID=A0AAN8QM56_9TELE
MLCPAHQSVKQRCKLARVVCKMGMSLSYPLVKEPESYVDPDFNEDSDEMNFAMEMHEINLRYTYDMIQQRIRSIKETAKFDKYSYDWNTSVLDLKNKFPHWTADDLLNMRRQFEIFDTNKDRLLDFSEFCASLNMVNDASTMEARKEMFNTADKDNYKSINFEEYLQLMYDLKQGTPVPKPLESEDDKDTATGDIICEVARMDTFQQMCYGVF